MDTTVTKAGFLARLRAERDEWEALLAEVGAARLDESGATGHWSVKDVVAHVMWYEAWVNERLADRTQGIPYGAPEIDSMYYHDRNERIYQMHHDRLAADVLADGRQVFADLYAWAEALSEAELNATGLFPDTPPDWPAWRVFADMSYLHYRKHAALLRAWLDQRATAPA